MFVDSGKVTRGRNSDSRDMANGGGFVPSDDDSVFWMRLEDEYFGKIDDRMRDILKFHIHSSEYILNIINDTLNLHQEKDWSDFVTTSMTLTEGLRGWNRVPREVNGEGFGLFENNGELQNTLDGYVQDPLKEEQNKALDLEEKDKQIYDGKRIKSISLTLSIPPLVKPTDFPRELTHCRSLREIIYNLVKIQCAYKYTRLNTSRNLYSILDINEGFDIQDKSLNGTCNYICLVPDVISGPSVEWCNNLSESEKEKLICKDESYYNYNDISDEWIFNINNKIENMELRKSLLDTSHLFPYNYYKNDLKEEKEQIMVSNKMAKQEGNNKIKSILGTGESLENNDCEYFRMDPTNLVPVVELENRLYDEDSAVSKIKRVKSFGDFFQENLHISPNRRLNDYNLEMINNLENSNKLSETKNVGYLNLSSIMDSDKRIDFEVSNKLNNGCYIFQDITQNSLNEHNNGEFDQRYLNRQKDKELSEISYSLIKRLRNISSLKLDMFREILSRVENERQPNPSYWYRKEYELNDYYRRKQYDIGYNYTLERQARDLEKFRLACIESKYLPNEWQETALCSICGNDTDWDEDPIYFCDGCYQPAHHSCVNPKQPFRYNSTRMLNVLERERKCQQGDLDSSNPNKKEDEIDEDDQWLCDVCLNIKSQLLDHQHLFFGIIRMASGPRDKQAIEQVIQSIQNNVNPFLSQLISYNVISSSIRDQSFTDPIVFPWFNDWIFPEITQEDSESNLEEESSRVVITERRKGRPRKTPLLSLTTLNKSNFRYFTFNFSSINLRSIHNSGQEEEDAECQTSTSNINNHCHDYDHDYNFDNQSYHHFEWVPTYQIPYNFANLEIFKIQIFNPVKWYKKQEAIRKANQTPPPTLISCIEPNLDEDYLVIEKNSTRSIKFRGSSYTSLTYHDDNFHNINNNVDAAGGLLEIFKHDEAIIRQLEEKKVIIYDQQNNSYKVKIKVPICQLCGYDAYCRSGGIMKKTVDGFWAHIRCALGNSSVLSSDGNYLRIKVDLQRNKIKCEGCGKIDCSPILCYNNQCSHSYHINCASSRKDCIVDWENSKPLLYCPEHSCNIAPTILLRKYQLSNFNKWYNHRFENQQYIGSIFGNIFTLPSIVRQTFLADLRDDTRTVIFLTRLLSKSKSNSAINIQTVKSQDEAIPISGDCYLNVQKMNTDQEHPRAEGDNSLVISEESQIVLNGFAKFHLYMPELVYVQSIDTVLSRLVTPWSGEVNFWQKLIPENALASFGISDFNQINHYKYLDNSRIIITSIFGIMEVLLNRMVNPYEIRLITLMIASKMGFGPWFSLFYYWKFIPLTFYYNIIKSYSDLSLYEPRSYIYSLNKNILLNDCSNNKEIQMKNTNYHLNLFGPKNLSIEKLHSNEAHLKSINSCSSIISQNWNYCCQLCGYQIILNNSTKKSREQSSSLFIHGNNMENYCGEINQISANTGNFNNSSSIITMKTAVGIGYSKIPYLLKCQVCNVVICSICNNIYQYGFVSDYNKSILNDGENSNLVDENYSQSVLITMRCQRCVDFEHRNFQNVITESSCCLCTRFDGILLPLRKGSQIDFSGVKSRKTLLVDGSIPLDDQLRLTYDVWIHPVCLEWLVMARVQVFSLNNIVLIDKKHFGNICKYCGFSNGATISCALSTCDTYFHVSCGRSIGCKFDSSRIKSKQNDHYYSLLNSGGSSFNVNSSGVSIGSGVYRRAWCISHNQCNNNNNSIIINTGINKSGGNSSNNNNISNHDNNNNNNNNMNSHNMNSYGSNFLSTMGSFSSSSQDLTQLRTLYSNIIQNNNEVLDRGEQGLDINRNINVSYALNQNLETSLKMSLLSYYGLVLSVDQKSKSLEKISKDSDVIGDDDYYVNGPEMKGNNILIDSRNPLFSRKIEFNQQPQSSSFSSSTTTSSSFHSSSSSSPSFSTSSSSSSSSSTATTTSDHDILYINKWEDLIQILVYEVISRFIYGIGIPKQKTINFSKSQRRRNTSHIVQKNLQSSFGFVGEVGISSGGSRTGTIGGATNFAASTIKSTTINTDTTNTNTTNINTTNINTCANTTITATNTATTTTYTTLGTSTTSTIGIRELSLETGTGLTNNGGILESSSSIQNLCPACDKIYKRDWQQVCLDWIYCDLCNNWYHWYCLGLHKENIPSEKEPFHCFYCLERKKKSRRGRKRKNLQINDYNCGDKAKSFTKTTIIAVCDGNNNDSKQEDGFFNTQAPAVSSSSSTQEVDLTSQSPAKGLKEAEVSQDLNLGDQAVIPESSSSTPSPPSSSSFSSSLSSLISIDSSQFSSNSSYNSSPIRKWVKKKQPNSSYKDKNKTNTNNKRGRIQEVVARNRRRKKNKSKNKRRL
ncbi:4x PHD domain containing [Cryptosporidium sp. chipmunk genotype I]|uniref:4x PHD domain containing n=1 Tax=Cryptosporidium sp. chipmunk genotype I TaxID=1280935 RepID=UPI00351A3BA2|nr:4x PHD domain containing [Cryptosporidium sp. chipmunk genotype I]